MPYRSVRGVDRGVQDEQELKKIKWEEKRKRREKTQKWCVMIGLTLIEFVLCLVCFGLGYYYYYTAEIYRNSLGRNYVKSIRSLLERPAPLAISSVFLTLTYVDLISWHSLRPVTYFAWIMVASAGFLMFLLYAGCIVLTSDALHSYIAIVFGCITALVFLADLICMLMSLKRFPVPHWVLKRKYEKLDQCVCTGDYDPEEEEVERPICRCGDHWGEPCTCDDPDLTCGCSLDKAGKPPCECCECAAQVLVADDDGATIYGSVYDGRSIVSTMTGCDELEERRKTTFSQASLPMEQICSQFTPGRYCVDGPLGRSTFAVSDPCSGLEAISTARKSAGMSAPRKSTMAPNRVSTASTAVEPMAASSRFHQMSAASRTGTIASRSRILAPSGSRGIGSPSMTQAAKHGGLHGTLTETIGAPSMGLASRVAINKPLPKSKSQMVYSVYTTTVDDQEAMHESIASKYYKIKHCAHKAAPASWSRDGEAVEESWSSTDEEIGAEGDNPTRKLPANARGYSGKCRRRPDKGKRLRFSSCTATERVVDPNLHLQMGYMSDPELAQGPSRIYTLPGQVSSVDDTDASKICSARKNASVSARERCTRRTKSPNTFRVVSEYRPRTTVEALARPRIIRNVSTTVRAVRTLSRVVEADNESRSVSQSDHRGSDQYPSECTITINKVEFAGKLSRKGPLCGQFQS
ncbi:uncharacterized protein LOC109545322 isoform X3 [Dendroctonus ponderosae]|uniref:uncharacterized protein LOC109545322 isoform X3 n=1 Tax=Dendroctonus ponderosae TaxID=77166 RepID=UPI002034BCCD|nr:uncharacterized protein LOC109545322 isoform X3 [Dendroctonus ponderosae]